MFKYAQLVFVLVLQIKNSLQQDVPPPTVAIADGVYLEGIYQYSVDGRVIDAFLGIPYAKPPVGSLRFSDPVPAKRWRGTKEVKEIPLPCLQNDLYEKSGSPFGSEDCLYLNVFTPRNRQNHALSVMVYFHGGSYYLGSSDPANYGPDRLLDHDVILVTVNYRLGALGFLSTLTYDSPGNYGLKDQNLALQWVRDHISAFGGNEQDVTIFGQSAGAASVSLHMVSKLSSGLFHKAILQSGNYYDPWAFVAENEAEKRAKRLAGYLKCPIPSNRDYHSMIECLRHKNADSIVSAQELFFVFPTGDPATVFAPVVEPESHKAFLDRPPWEISQSYGDRIPVIVGATSQEGLVNSAAIIYQYTNEFIHKFDQILPTVFFYDHLSPSEQSRITEKIRENYFEKGFEWSRKNNRNLTNMFSDHTFFGGMEKFLERRRYTARGSNTFAYIFDHNPPKSTTQTQYGGGSEFYGVCHGDELPFLFPYGQLGLLYKKRDRQMDWALGKMWTDFAKTGDPTPASSWITPKWKRVKSFPYRYALIGSKYYQQNRLHKTDYIASRSANASVGILNLVDNNSNESTGDFTSYANDENDEDRRNDTSIYDEEIVDEVESESEDASRSLKGRSGRDKKPSKSKGRYRSCRYYSRKSPCTVLKNRKNRFWSGFYI